MIIIFSLEGDYFTSNDRSQNTFCLLTNTSYFRFKKGTDYVLRYKSKRVFNSELNPLYTTF